MDERPTSSSPDAEGQSSPSMRPSVHSASQRPSSFEPLVREDEPVAWFTWLIGGAAALVVLTAGAVFLSVDEAPAPPLAAEAVASSPQVVDNQEELTPRDPLDISPAYLDARHRALLWNDRATLSSILVPIDGGQPSGPSEFSFGVPGGPSIPGTPLDQARLRVRYDDGEASQSEDRAKGVERSLSPPNCPLEAAFRKLSQSGHDVSGKVRATYLHSASHKRGIWAMNLETEGRLQNIDADSCALLMR